ncbi:hypothetical protein FG379_001872 [Cryptosporidium bovis]|uniref:uncharacterized protein n=1 Tax=Cryptosporidium bovis TaxID=310047 RepID=UPI00351A9B39|nr:hypothetical protein FG379_001872 [Cryptosporidium bovis]
MAIKIELKFPGTDVGMSLELGHLNTNEPLEDAELDGSGCDGCKSESMAKEMERINNKSENVAIDSQVNKKEENEADIVTKMFTSFMKCTASNVNLNQNFKNKKISELKQRKKLNNSEYYEDYDEDEDPLARGILGKGCSSDFSVSQSLYPDDILVSYEPRRRKRQTNRMNNNDHSFKQNTNEATSPPHNPDMLTNNGAIRAKDMKEVKIIPINKTTDAKILPNRKFKENEKGKYDISCISVPLFCDSNRYIGSFSNLKRHGISDSCNLNQGRKTVEPCKAVENSYTRLVSKKNSLRCGPVYSGEDENTLISVPSSIYPDNILLTIRNHKSRQKKNKKREKHN